MKSILVMAMLAAAGCGGKGGDAAGGDGDDWTSKAIKPTPITVEGKKFTIDLPDGMRKKEADGETKFDFLVGEYAKTPDISISKGGGWKSLEDYKKFEKDVTTWLRADTLPDGWIATNENTAYKGKEDYLVHADRTVGGITITCSARVTPWARGATVKDKLPQIEKICLSIKPAG